MAVPAAEYVDCIVHGATTVTLPGYIQLGESFPNFPGTIVSLCSSHGARALTYLPTFFRLLGLQKTSSYEDEFFHDRGQREVLARQSHAGPNILDRSIGAEIHSF